MAVLLLAGAVKGQALPQAGGQEGAGFMGVGGLAGSVSASSSTSL